MICIDADKCLGCGSCANACPRGAITLAENVAAIDQARCDECERCLEICPERAIYSVVEVLPQRRVPEAVGPVSRPLASRVVPPLVTRLASRLAPVALDLAMGAVDRWLSRRGMVPSGSSPWAPRGTGMGSRCRRRRGWRV